MKFNFLTTNDIKPAGWLRRQLEIQAAGLSGNLDKVWPDIRDSKWIGGDREGWERVPYWLDGFIPLAYLLDDDDMKARAKKYIDKILEFQKPDGWICPNGDTPIEKYDTWAIILISKVFTVYYDCTGDERIPESLYRMMKNYYDLLSTDTIKMFKWAKARWFEGFIALKFLKERYPDEEWIDKLGVIFDEQGLHYENYTEEWKIPLNKWTFQTHIVNMGMMIKSEAVSHDMLGKPYTDLAEKLYSILDKYNGTAVGGIFTGDECLSGLSPIQGSELCSVVEFMYSYEWLYAVTGEAKWAERLERAAFNALPATISDDMWAHQYDQQSNQIECIKMPKKTVFRTNVTGEAHLFGLEPEYGCCTSNFNQGWPKLAIAAFMKSSKGLEVAVPIPTEVNTEWKGANVSVKLETEYPFKNTFVYKVKADRKTSMKLRVRVPSFAKYVKVDGETVGKCKVLSFGGFSEEEKVIRVEYGVEPEFIARPHRLASVRYGSLTFSVPIEYEAVPLEFERKGVERKFPYCDYHYERRSDFNYAYVGKELTVKENPVNDIPFSSKNPPLTITANVSHINWGFEDGYITVCAKVPESRKPLDEAKPIELYPYGCSKLRMTEIPLLKDKK